MNVSRRVMLPLILLAFSLPALAKCPMGTVKVHGQVEYPPADAASVEVSITLETPKGVKSATAPVSNGEFSIEIQFGTQSAPYFPLWGHRCNTVPKFVDVKVMIGDRVVGQARLVFKDAFEPESPNVYRLKHELTIKASREGGKTEAPKGSRSTGRAGCEARPVLFAELIRS
jgi:hypothetical protein